MKITVRLFAILRECAGTDRIALDLREGTDVRGARDDIAQRVPQLRDLLPRVAFAVNHEYVKGDSQLHDGDELALIPPVSGG